MPETETEAGPGLAFEQAYAELRLPLLRLAVLLTGSRDEAEDAVQSVFAAALPRWPQIEQPLPYLRRAVANVCADAHRKRFRRPPEAAGELTTTIPELDETWALLVALPTRQRAVVVLHYYEDLPLVEIAAVLRRPAATVRSDRDARWTR